MPKINLPVFEQAVKSGQSYVSASVLATKSQRRFLALTYLAHLESKRRPRAFQKMIESRLGRSPSKPETKRPFLLILHALLGKEDDMPKSALPQFSRLTSALEEIEHAFKGVKPDPTVNELIVFIQDAGGVGGLYDLSRIGSIAEVGKPYSENQKIVDLKPNEIPLPVLGARVTKVGRGYRLRLIEREPGEYLVRLRIGRGGIVESILDENISDVDAA